jgi:hypothetical protein
MPTQTFLDLYRELQAGAYAKTDRELVFHAYELAARLFAGSYRPTYKPFVCHLVGTASVLARAGERSAVIAAAILHSAYSLGVFGDGTRGVTAPKRRVIAGCVGAEVEELVHQYTIADWTRFETDEGASPTQGMERDLWAIKLADLFDDIHDNTMKVVPDKGMVMHTAHGTTARARLVERARQMFGPAMAAEFDVLFDKVAQEEIDDLLVNERTSSFVEIRKPLTPPAPTFRMAISRRIRGILRSSAAS